MFNDTTDPSEKTAGTDGKLSFTGLVDGRYMIEETEQLAGYVQQEDMKLYFTIANGEVTWTDDEGNELSQQNPASYESNTFLVGNRAGVSLPTTGGAGTLAA